MLSSNGMAFVWCPRYATRCDEWCIEFLNSSQSSSSCCCIEFAARKFEHLDPHEPALRRLLSGSARNNSVKLLNGPRPSKIRLKEVHRGRKWVTRADFEKGLRISAIMLTDHVSMSSCSRLRYLHNIRRTAGNWLLLWSTCTQEQL